MSIITAVIVLLLAFALQAAAPPTPDGSTIVITATMAALRQAQERCTRGECTPREDIVASIRYAEAVFRTGRYLDARRILQAAIARDKSAGGSEPEAVAALYEATVTVALHDGEQDVARRAGSARVQLLRNRFGADDARLIQAELDQADMLLVTRQADEAAARYPILARRAKAANLPTLHAAAIMRQALLAHADHRERSATALLTGLVDDEDLSPALRLAARALLARFARELGNAKPADELVASFLADGNSGQPVLVWQPTIERPADPAQPHPYSIVDRTQQGGKFMNAEWADIGFLIRPDGTVDAPEVLRGSVAQGWSQPIRKAIAQRRYLPVKSGDESLFRIERWTLTGSYCVPKDSLITRRGCDPHLVQVDLTPETATKS